MKKTSAQKKVIYIVHEFPPIAGGQVNRVRKFSKYLPDYGWQPIILTAKPEDCFYLPDWGIDQTLLAELSNAVEVHRVASPLERYMRNWFKRGRSSLTSTQNGAGKRGKFTSNSLSHLVRPLRQFHVAQDQSALWLPWAYQCATNLIREKMPRAVVTSGPPHLIHLLGLTLKKRFNIPWVADFRDGWTDNTLFRASSSLRRKIDKYIEAGVVANADNIIGVTKHICDYFKTEYPMHRDKVSLIYNGFDKANFTPRVQENPVGESLSFVHIGGIGATRDPQPLITALKGIFENQLLPRKTITLQFIGKYHRVMSQLPEWVDVIPYLPHQHAIERMMTAGVLVLIAGSAEGEAAFTSKVFEYLAAQRPILALIPLKGELANLLRSYSMAEVVAPEDIPGIQKAILRIYEKARLSSVPNQSDISIIQQFDRYHQTGQLAAILDSVSFQL
jgi:glycosyltransferase involved in cell wall biosynthesis